MPERLQELHRPTASSLLRRASGERRTLQTAMDDLRRQIQARFPADLPGIRWRVEVGPGRHFRQAIYLHAFRVPTEPPC